MNRKTAIEPLTFMGKLSMRCFLTEGQCDHEILISPVSFF